MPALNLHLLPHQSAPAMESLSTGSSSSPSNPPPPPLSLPRPLFDRLMAQQWTSITRNDDLTPFLPLLAYHVDCAINRSTSASSALSNPSTIALLKATAAYTQLKDCNQYSNLNIQHLWATVTTATPPPNPNSPSPSFPPPPDPPPPPPSLPSPSAFDSLPHVDRLTLVLTELHRLESLHRQSPSIAPHL